MQSRTLKAIFGVLFVLAVSTSAFGIEVPLRNWEVPSADYLGKQVDVTQAIPFVGVEPCRIVDTRGGGVFTGAYGPPALVMNATRNFDLNSAAHCPGIPSGVDAYSLNVTVASPAGPGDIRMWPQDNPPTVVTSVQNWSSFGAAFAIANSVVMPAGTGGGVTVQMAGTTGHVLIDINGYFTDSGNDNVTLDYHVNDSTFAGHFFNSHTATAAFGLEGDAVSAVDGSAGLAGVATTAGTGRTYGVFGETNSTGAGAAGVFGVDGTIEESATWCPSCGSAGVRGHSNSQNGVLGVSSGVFYGGAVGIRVNPTTGAYISEGSLGFTSGGTEYGVFANSGTIGCNGCTKMFVEPHPSDAAKVIRYVSLEGPEAGTYFRGRAKFQRGLARIRVPESFRMVSDTEGLSIQVTPIGAMASVAVLRIDLDEIVVQGSRDVEFFYTVNGVRPGFKDFEPVGEGQEFVPRSADWKMPDTWNHDVKRRLIANGTYNEDGTPNMETAKRLGWDKRWTQTQKGSPGASRNAHADKN